MGWFCSRDMDGFRLQSCLSNGFERSDWKLYWIDFSFSPGHEAKTTIIYVASTRVQWIEQILRQGHLETLAIFYFSH